MVFADFPFLRYLVFFILGILLYPLFGWVTLEGLSLVLGFSWFFYLSITIYVEKNRLFSEISWVFPLLAYLQLVLAGMLFSHLRDFQNNPDHLIHSVEKMDGYLALVIGQDEAKPNSTANRLLLKKTIVGGEIKNKKGEILVYHRSDTALLPGDFIWVWGHPQTIPGPTNPYEFDYQQFTIRQGVAHRHFIGERFEILGTVPDFPIEAFFINLRAKIMERFEVLFQDTRAIQIANALLLGQKKSLDRELSEAYATAGAMHVLAVSGLHVGIVYGFFFLWIKPYRLERRRRILYLSGIILLIWGYALLTGMSPSVMRAATMFSLMALAQMKSRSPSIFNAIALSALILLLYDPNLIYAVGFQLSYIALLGILLIQPFLVKIWQPKYRILDYCWQISTVAVAAQLATFPLSAYYFHIFPSYFLISNLMAIPGAFLIMSIGVPFMLFSNISIIGPSLAFLTERVIKQFNNLVLGIQYLPGSRLSGIYLETQEVFLYFGFMGLILWLCHRPHKLLLWGIVFGFFLVGLFRLVYQPLKQSKNILTVYHLDKGIAMDYRQYEALFVFDKADISAISYKVLPHRERFGVEKKYSLKAFEKENKQVVLLPNGAILPFSEDDVELVNMSFYPHGINAWMERKWVPVSISDSISVNPTAYRLVFD